MLKKLCSFLSLSVLLLAGSASATPVLYEFVSGSASVGLSINGSSIGSVATDLDGSFVVYDAMAMTIPDFEWATSASLGPLDLAITATPGSGYTSGPGVAHDVDLGPVAVDLEAVLAILFPVSFDLGLSAAGPVGVDVAIAGDMGTFSVSETLFSFRKFHKEFVISLDARFLGKAASGPTIPEPSSALLFAIGALVVAGSVRRISQASGAAAR